MFYANDSLADSRYSEKLNSFTSIMFFLIMSREMSENRPYAICISDPL